MQTPNLVESARQLQEQKRYEESLALWEELLSSNSTLLAARLGAASDCSNLCDLNRAEQHYSVAIKQRPDHIAALTGMANVLRKQDRFIESAGYWKAAWQQAPERANLAVYHLDNLIRGKDPSYRESLWDLEPQIDSFDRGYIIIANALSHIQDSASECDFLISVCTGIQKSNYRLGMVRRLCKLLSIEQREGKTAQVLDVCWHHYADALIDHLATTTFASPLSPEEAGWIVDNEAAILNASSENDINATAVVARALLWHGSKSAAIQKYTQLKDILDQTDAGLGQHDIKNKLRLLALLSESCIEIQDKDSATFSLQKLAALAIDHASTTAINYLLPFGQITSIPGHLIVQAAARAMAGNYLLCSSGDRDSINLADPRFALSLTRLCIQSNLTEEAEQLGKLQTPNGGHWLGAWLNRNEQTLSLHGQSRAWAINNEQKRPITPGKSSHKSSLKSTDKTHAEYDPSPYLQVRELRAWLPTPTATLSKGAIPLFAKFKNEEARIPGFLDHYRNLGITHFFLIDNLSSDGAVEYLSQQTDVYLWQAPGSLESNYHCTPWINALIDQYSPAHWCVSTDIDEYLDFSGSDSNDSLSGLTESMALLGEEILPAFMLDMFPDNVSEVRAPLPHENLQVLHPWFDNTYQFFGSVNAPYMQAAGGFRNRLWPGICNDTLVKTPVFNSTRGIRLVHANHDTNGGVASTRTGVLRHYRFSDDINRRKAFSDYISKTHTSASALESDALADYLPGPDSLRFESSRQLEELGLINVSVSDPSAQISDKGVSSRTALHKTAA